MNAVRFGLTIAVAVFVLSVPLCMMARWYAKRRRSRLNTIAHQVDGPYRRIGEKRRR